MIPFSKCWTSSEGSSDRIDMGPCTAMDSKRPPPLNPLPPGDPEEKFIWVKKQKLDEQRGLTREELDRREAQRRERNRREIEKLERQRLTWEAEREQKQLDRETVQLGREKEMLGDWQEKERRFHLGQALAKAELRIKGGRGDQLDWVIVNTCQDPDITLISLRDPIELLEGLEGETIDGLEAALEEHRGLERDPDSLNYLDAISSYLHYQQNMGLLKTDSHQVEVVKEEITALLCGKTVADLTRLERGIKAKLSGPNPADPTYWQGILTHLDTYRRRALVRETNGIVLERRKAQLADRATVLDDSQVLGATPVVGADMPFAPTPIPSSISSASVSTAESINWDMNPEALRMYLMESNRKVSKDELPFNNEADDLSTPTAGLVKPRFFNRVRTCYEWNKYNQTHYDSENPPPKTVQGYRFNVFYPTLAESQLSDALSGKTSAPPSYKLESDQSNPDMKIIRFRAGAPYDELVFRIQSDDWDMSHRQGFKCAFEGGVLRLHFWFKSQRYTR